MNSNNRNKKINCLITSRIIDLQAKGYDLDYFVLDRCVLCCMQNNLLTPLKDAVIELIDLGYDHFYQEFKYIHTVENTNGDKGMLIVNRIFSWERPLNRKHV
jgi:hypothetical protein